MTKEERLERMKRGQFNKEYTPKHYLLACEVLDQLMLELTTRGLFVYDDPNWPYHILVKAKDGKYTSLYCKGFRKTIEIQKLRKDGMADTRYEEVAFSTPAGAANYIAKRYSG